MFEGCTSLKRVPELTAEELPDNFCESMFKGCTSLQNTDDYNPAFFK